MPYGSFIRVPLYTTFATKKIEKFVCVMMPRVGYNIEMDVAIRGEHNSECARTGCRLVDDILLCFYIYIGGKSDLFSGFLI